MDERGVAVLKDSNGKEVTRDQSGIYYQLANEPLHTVRFIKTSSYGSGVTLSGAVFSLTGISDQGTNVELTATSDSSGIVVFEGLETGTYMLKETVAPDDYELNPTTYPVEVKADDTFTIQGLDQMTLSGTTTKLYNFKDDPTGGIVKVTKIWKDDSNNEERPVPDITISTTKPFRNPKGYTLTFDANGGTFADGTTENDMVYSGSQLVEGSYQIPTSVTEGDLH